MAGEEAQQGQAEQPKGGIPRSLIIGVGAVVLVALVYFFFLRPKPPEDEELAQVEEKKEEREWIYEQLETLTLNPKDTHFNKYFTFKIDLLVANEETLDALKSKPLYKTQITDALVELLSDKTVEELEGPTAKEDLKKEILHRLNALLGPSLLKEKKTISEAILDIYYVKYLVQ